MEVAYSSEMFIFTFQNYTTSQHSMNSNFREQHFLHTRLLPWMQADLKPLERVLAAEFNFTWRRSNLMEFYSFVIKY
jgi:hypothetical protein